MKDRCLIFHSYGKWEVKSCNYLYLRNGKEYNGVESIQERRCKKCGYVQRRNLIR